MTWFAFMEGVGQQALSWVDGHPFGWFSPVIAFALGVLNTLNPCTISILPLWGLYLFGQNDKAPNDPTQNDETHNDRISGALRGWSTRFQMTLLFTLGMVTALSVLGILALQMRWWIFGAWNQPWLWGILGGLTVLLGLSMCWGGQWLEGLQGHSHGIFSVFFRLSQAPYLHQLKPFLLGASYALILSPCGTPFLIALTVLLVNSPHPAVSVLSILLYSVGQTVFFFLLPWVMPWLQKRLGEGLWQRLQGVSGWLLVLLGLWMALSPIWTTFGGLR